MKRIPKQGLIGDAAMREAASEFGQVVQLVRDQLKTHLQVGNEHYVCIRAIYPDRVIIERDGKHTEFAYAIGEGDVVTIGDSRTVRFEPVPVATPPAPAEPSTTATLIEARPIEGQANRYLVRVIRAGVSGNNVDYPPAVLREAVPLFNGCRVFSKSDEEHIAGGGKAVANLIGRLIEAVWVEAEQAIHAILEVLETAPIAAHLREAVARGMTDLFGLSIDVAGKQKRRGRLIEAVSFTKVNSVDLIVEPGADGRVIRFAEAQASVQESENMFRAQMIEALKRLNPQAVAEIDALDDATLMSRYTEAMRVGTGSAPVAGIAADEVRRMIEASNATNAARSYAVSTINASTLPGPAKTRLITRFVEAQTVTPAEVDAAIRSEGEYLAQFVESGRVQLGDFVPGADQADKTKQRLVDLFDPTKPARSFREAYCDITGDRLVTGMVQSCDMRRMRESLGYMQGRFAEAITSATFAYAMVDAIQVAMQRAYANNQTWSDWMWLCDVVPVTDFRTNHRPQIGGYGNLPAVAQSADYAALTSPGDFDATYAATKRGGIETITLETIANDNVGLLRRIPLGLSTAAARTLYEFVYGFLLTNANAPDGTALIHADHANIGTTALAAASWSAARLRLLKQTELSSTKRLNLRGRHIAVPPELEETASDLFKQNTENEANFRKQNTPEIHVIGHATDANNWYLTADKADQPLLEIGFYGSETPELFTQDMPNVGSLFSADKITMKVRHIYGGNILDHRGFDGSIVA